MLVHQHLRYSVHLLVRYWITHPVREGTCSLVLTGKLRSMERQVLHPTFRKWIFCLTDFPLVLNYYGICPTSTHLNTLFQTSPLACSCAISTVLRCTCWISFTPSWNLITVCPLCRIQHTHPLQGAEPLLYELTGWEHLCYCFPSPSMVKLNPANSW